MARFYFYFYTFKLRYIKNNKHILKSLLKNILMKLEPSQEDNSKYACDRKCKRNNTQKIFITSKYQNIEHTNKKDSISIL